MKTVDFTPDYKINKIISANEADLIMVNKTTKLSVFVGSKSLYSKEYDYQIGITKLTFNDLIKSDKRFYSESDTIFQIVEIFEGKNQNVILVKKSKNFNMK